MGGKLVSGKKLSSKQAQKVITDVKKIIGNTKFSNLLMG